jgi:hypothetical protein
MKQAIRLNFLNVADDKYVHESELISRVIAAR